MNWWGPDYVLDISTWKSKAKCLFWHAAGYEPVAHRMVAKLRSQPMFHDEEFVKKNLSPEDQARFLALP